jgi:hypothetical protein
MGTSLSKLASQWSRLMGLTEGAPGQANNHAGASGGAGGVRLVAWHVRAADNEWVSRVWSLAQSEAELPAPVISVDGASGWQLWFALAQPRPQAEVERVLGHLITGLLGEAGAGAVPLLFTCWLGGAEVAVQSRDGAPLAAWPPVPRQVGADRWSAFIAPDLVPVFAESPWLDCAPGEEGQANLLARLSPIDAADWARLAKAASTESRPAAAPTPVSAASTAPASSSPAPASVAPSGDPRAFLLAVMNDPGVEMALRIEAARVLLAHG